MLLCAVKSRITWWYIDFDDRKLYDKFFSDMETLTVDTPSGGVHLYFFSVEPMKKTPKFRGFPIDVQAEASLIIIPPSTIGDSGYKVLKDLPVKTEDVNDLLNERLPKQEVRKAVDKSLEKVIKEIKKITDLSEVIERYINKEINGRGY